MSSALQNAGEFIWEVAKIVILALAIVLPIRYFLFQPFVIQGSSMEPNFYEADYLIVDELSYRFREPERGEVVVFKYPLDASKRFIKRIIGLPGETVEILKGETYINGSKMLEQHVSQRTYEDAGGKTLPTNRYYVMGDNRTQFSDSRSDEIGLVEADNIVGKARWVIWPLSHLSGL